MLKGLISYSIFATSLVSGVSAPEFKANKIKDPPIIDGILDDSCWQQATRIEDDFRRWLPYDPNYMKIAPAKTVVLSGYDAENLYFGFICVENDISLIRANTKNQNFWYPILHDDQIYIDLTTFVDRTEQYTFVVNPNGIRGDFFNIEDTPYTWSYADFANIVWYAGAKILDTCWTVEIRIPFQSLRFPSTYIDYWLVNFIREIGKEGEKQYGWSPYVEDKSRYTYRGKMYINDRISSPKKIELLPYGIGGLTADSTVVSEQDFSLHLGIGAKYLVNYDNVFDFAVLPDFSQIESDAPQIDVNTTFALYYPEKRPFFMERKTFFDTPLEVFYSRMINDPLAAVKFTGSIKDYAFGYVGAYDRHTPFIVPLAEQSFSFGSDLTSYSNILRLKRTITTGAHLGLLATDREFTKEGFNRLAGLDGALTFLRSNSLRCQGLVSWTREPFDTMLFNGYGLTYNGHSAAFDAEELTGQAFLVEAGHRDKYLTFNGYCHGLSPEFRADNGYVGNNDYTKAGFSLDLQYGLKKYFIEYIKPGLTFDQTYRYFGEKAGTIRGGSIDVQFKHLIGTHVTYELADRLFQGNWFSDLWSYSSCVSISTVKALSLNFFIGYGRQINHYSLPYGTGYRLSPSGSLQLSAGKIVTNFGYHRYLFWENAYGDWLFDQQVFETKLSFAFTNVVNFRVLAQYVSSSHNFFASPLISFVPTSLTFFYLGSNHNFAINNSLRNIPGYEHRNSQIFLKVQYLLRY